MITGPVRRLLGKRVPRDELTARIERAAAEATEGFRDAWFDPSEVRDTRMGAELLAGSPEELVALTRRCFAIGASGEARHVRVAARGLASAALRRKLPFTEDDFAALLDDLAAHGRRLSTVDHPIVPLVGAIERRCDGVAPARLQHGLERVAHRIRDDHADDAKVLLRIRALTSRESGPALPDSRDPWMQALRAAGDTELARRVLALATGGTSARPTKAFRVQCAELIEREGRAEVAEAATRLLRAATATRPKIDGVPPGTGDVLRGVAWIAGAAGGEEAVRALGELAVAGWKKVPGWGPLSQKAANGALLALAELPEGAGELGRVRAQVKQASAVRAVEAAISGAAERQGIPRDEFEERAVPDFGLEREVALGDHVAVLSVEGLRFRTSAGRTLKSVPAAVRAEHADALAELKRTAKDVTTMAAAQKSRLERLLLADRVWTYEAWRERYLDHGLVGPLARRLIWVVDGEPAMFVDGEPAGETVRLWHPVDAAADEVAAWRRFLEAREITQPFKQAHREVYLLTDAERETRVYSNRFAAHVLRQHQMAALARERGWRYALQGGWDSGEAGPTRELPEHDLTVTFWIEPPVGSDDLNEMGVSTHVVTDQVRYTAGGLAIELEDIDARVFSETMRDVDLFVGVTSIGNDPAWVDRGERDHLAYWHDYAFGELGAQAEVRRDLLERLLPKLAIRDVAALEGRFLRVEGKRRTYKIHLGSANILMEPNDQYLCIVPGYAKDATGKVFLPFEGDQVLAVILSKAFLLARDDKIDDPAIVNQIGAARPRR